jgi:hypothetical protein
VQSGDSHHFRWRVRAGGAAIRLATSNRPYARRNGVGFASATPCNISLQKFEFVVLDIRRHALRISSYSFGAEV